MDRFDLVNLNIKVSLPIDREDDDLNKKLAEEVSKIIREDMDQIRRFLTDSEDTEFQIEVTDG